MRRAILTAILQLTTSWMALALVTDPMPVEAACGSLPGSLGTVTINVNVPAAGPYRIWVRELAPTAGASGFYFQLADAGLCQVTMGNANIPAQSWTWVDYQNGNTASTVSATLAAGNHRLVLSGLSNGTEIDKLELLSDMHCIPTGDGSNCTGTAVTTTTPGPTASMANSGSNSSLVNSPTPGPIQDLPIGRQLQAVAHSYLLPLGFAAGLLALAGVWFIGRHLGLFGHPKKAANESVHSAK
jgi:hypothetical protein